MKDSQWQKFRVRYSNNPEQKLSEWVDSQLDKVDPNAANKEMRTFDTLGVLRHYGFSPTHKWFWLC